jgi:hypothetical protein
METKKCTKCGEIKNTCEFYKNSKSKDGLKTWCKTCHLEDSRKREKNYNEKRREYRLKNREEYRENKKKYYNDNKEKILNGNALWRQTFNGRLLSYKRAAKARNVEWLLSDEEFNLFWNKPCSDCGCEIETVGIDRLESDKGYFLENCVSCCSTCNKMKMELSKDDFINKIKEIIKFLNL